MRATRNILPMSSTPAKNGYAGQARLVNCYAEKIEQGKEAFVVHACDGLAEWATLPGANGGVRAVHALPDGSLLVVAGRLLYSVDATGYVTTLGGIASDGLVTMARNREGDPRVAIVCDGLLFFWQSGVVTQFTDFPEGMVPMSNAHLNGYFVFLTAGGDIYHSEVDSDQIGGLSFENAASNPDKGVRLWTRGQDLCVGGERTVEYYRDVGGDPFAFERTTSIDVGVLAAGSVANVAETSMFVAHDASVRILDGFQARVVSNPTISRWIEGQTASGLSATAWTAHGHTFYALSGSDRTWCYDVATALWHERETLRMGRWRASCVESANRKLIVGDYAAGTLYEMSEAFNKEADRELVTTIYSVPVAEFPHRLTHHALHLDMMPGVGVPITDTVELTADDGEPLTADDGEPLTADTDPEPQSLDPEVMVSWTDNGKQFGNEVRRPLGRVGQDHKKISIPGLGSAHNRTYRFQVSAAVKRMTVAAQLDASRLGR